jgi:glycogen debranching enzyme
MSSSVRATCEQVLRDNDRGRYTVPSPSLYPHQWAWDSAFAAIGWAHLDPSRAWTELETLMGGQWDDGRVPHILFHDLSGTYFPGPGFWGTERSSSISQPPVWATAARRIVELTGDHEPVAPLLERFDASHRFFHEQRDPLGWGAVAVAHPWESGLDNSPAWDAAMARVDVSDPPVFQRVDKATTGDASVRPTDDDYLRYACLVKAIAADDFGPGAFAVYDPMFTALLVQAEDDLAWLAARCGSKTDAAERAKRLREGLVGHLFTGDRFIYFDANAKQPVQADVIGGYLPLICGLPEDVVASVRSRLEERYATPYRFPSTSPKDDAFDARRYWRGPVWVNVAWLMERATGEAALRDGCIALVEKAGCREYYHPETGEGLGADSFAWTAALVIDWLDRNS